MHQSDKVVFEHPGHRCCRHRGCQVRRGLETFRQEVEEGIFPQEEHSPYKMPAEEEKRFKRLLAKVGDGSKYLRGDNGGTGGSGVMIDVV